MDLRGTLVSTTFNRFLRYGIRSVSREDIAKKLSLSNMPTYSRFVPVVTTNWFVSISTSISDQKIFAHDSFDKNSLCNKRIGYYLHGKVNDSARFKHLKNTI